MDNYVPGLVSIIMPSYNTGKFILETISSVQKQSYKKWEIILVDDCSTDNTISLLTKVEDNRIRIFINKKNSGAALSRNKALREARGEWIAFLDSDDLWTEDKLEKQIKFMIENNYKFSCAYCTYIDEESNSIGILDTSPLKMGKYMMLAYNWISCLTCMYHYPSIGLVQIEDIKKRNDYALWLKVIKKADCYCLPEVLGQYRVRKKSISHAPIIRLLKSHYDLFRKCEKRSIFASVLFANMNFLTYLCRKLFYIKNLR